MIVLLFTLLLQIFAVNLEKFIGEKEKAGSECCRPKINLGRG
jgi:hypothetical protein